MGTHAVEGGDVGARVAGNVRALRHDRRLSLQDLSERMRSLGRPILISGLSKVEQGSRRVDVDDLMALSLALDVTPNRLLLPSTAGESKISLTPSEVVTERDAWRWACGDGPLDLPGVFDLDRFGRWQKENRPHDPPDETTVEELLEHADALGPVLAAVRAAAVERGLSVESVLGYVRIAEHGRVMVDHLRAQREAPRGKR